MNNRPRRPYEQKQISKSGAIIFGLGLGALLATLAIVVGITLPSISHRLEALPFYAQTYYRKLVPHPEFLPTPAPTISTANAAQPPDVSALELDEQRTEATQLGDTLSASAQPTATFAPSPEPIATPVELLADTSAPAQVEPPASADLPAALEPLQEQVRLGNINHQWQTWNNCGPATVTMNMSFFGRPETQAEAAEFLKPNKNDKNVSPYELAAYARTTGLNALVRQGGSLEQLKLFLSNEIPIIAETWLVHDGDGLGHYRLLTGYNDESGQFNTFDSLNGPNYQVAYQPFDADWRVFNRLYVVVFPPEQTELVHSIIGQDLNDTYMSEQLLAQAQADLEANPDDAIAHFNQGEALTQLERYDQAVVAFDKARRLGLHWRRLWYQFAPFEAYYAVGRYQDVLELAEATIEGTGGLEEAYYYQGLALHATGQSGAEDAFEAALTYNPHFQPAQEALETLTQQGQRLDENPDAAAKQGAVSSSP